jgi:hypothetical protein
MKDFNENENDNDNLMEELRTKMADGGQSQMTK